MGRMTKLNTYTQEKDYYMYKNKNNRFKTQIQCLRTFLKEYGENLHLYSLPHYPNSENSPTWVQALTATLEKNPQIPYPVALAYKCLLDHVAFFCCGFIGITDHLRHDTSSCFFFVVCLFVFSESQLPVLGYMKGRILITCFLFFSGTCHVAV